MARRKSIPLEDFTLEQLLQLADDYRTIRREVASLYRDCLTEIRLPEVGEREQQLAVLRDLNSRDDLDIRISHAGNLNVYVRGPNEVIGHLGILRRPATTWCVPHGRYFP